MSDRLEWQTAIGGPGNSSIWEHLSWNRFRAKQKTTANPYEFKIWHCHVIRNAIDLLYNLSNAEIEFLIKTIWTPDPGLFKNTSQPWVAQFRSQTNLIGSGSSWHHNADISDVCDLAPYSLHYDLGFVLAYKSLQINLHAQGFFSFGACLSGQESSWVTRTLWAPINGIWYSEISTKLQSCSSR